MDFPRPPKWKRVLKRGAVAFVALFVVAVATGFAVQRWHDTHIPPAPGSYAVVADGRRLHYRLGGEGKYTFVLDAGLGDYSGSWYGFEKSLGVVGRTFVYDRAGVGWSDARSGALTYDGIADDLHAALAAAHVPPPYILVGHSFGGLTQTYYATRYPAGVAGLLLIDPAVRGQTKVMPQPPTWIRFVTEQLTRLAMIGGPQAMMRFSDPVKEQTKYLLAAGAEARLVMLGIDPWRGAKIDLGALPIYILTSDQPPPLPGKSEAELKAIQQTWNGLHEQLLTASTSAVRRNIVVAGSSHYIHGTHAEAVIAAAREFVQRIDSP